MSDMKITDSVRYIGADDDTLDLFESQYPVPDGVSYNSYLILDEKTAVMDTVDFRAKDVWLSNLEKELNGRSVDYLIVSHMEPDHAACIGMLAERYPKMQIVGNAKTFPMISRFFSIDFEERQVIVGEGDTLSLGSHTLQFFMAPMVHWPEVMVAYEQSEKILFSADGFGTFGALSKNIPWEQEAGRYYFNIVGKYGVQVQTLLKKAAGLDIQMICPLHGPVLKENLAYYINKYQIYSSYEPEEKGIVIACASIHGHTKQAAKKLAELLKDKGEKVIFYDLTREDTSKVIADAFKYDRMILAACTYDGGLFPPMEDFLHHLKSKGFRKRTIGIMENGSWAPVAGRHMKAILEQMKDITVCEREVTIKSAATEEDYRVMEELAAEITQ